MPLAPNAIHPDFTSAGLCNGIECPDDCHFRKLARRSDYQAFWRGISLTSSLDCVHRGKPVGIAECNEGCGPKIRLKTFACSIHGLCTLQKFGVGIRGRCFGCQEREAPPITRINHGAGGLGDALLGLCAVLGYCDSHRGENVVYAVAGTGLPFLRLFEGPPNELHTHDKVADLPDGIQINNGYNHECDTRGQRARIDRYCANLGGVTPRLPSLLQPDRIRAIASSYARCVVVAPCVADQNWRSRQYPRHSWITVERMLQSAGYRVILLDNVEDRLASFPGNSERAIAWDHERMTSLMINAACVVSNDSGPAHLSGILGTPTVVLGGATTPSRIYGFYPRVTSLDGPLDCNGCWWRGPYSGEHCQAACASLAAITPERIVQTVKRVVCPTETR